MSWVVAGVVLSAVAVFVLILGLVAYYADPNEWSGLAILVSTICLWSALLCVVCVPVDTYAASNGGAAEKQHVRVLYEVLFSTLLLGAFVLMPMAYFYYEGGTWESGRTGTLRRCCAALQFTLVFEFLVAAVLVVLLLVQPETCARSWRT